MSTNNVESNSDLSLPRVKLTKHDEKIDKTTIVDIDNQSNLLEINQDNLRNIINNTNENILLVARKAFSNGKTKPKKFRKQQLNNLLSLLNENEELLIEALYKDLKKHRNETVLFEIEIIANDIRNILINLNDYMKHERPDKALVNFFDGIYVHNEPYGIVLIIGAWNYPLKVTLGPLVGAIAAGNCAIIKPSELSQHTSELLANLLPKYLDTECYHVVLGGANETTELLKQRFDYIFYTGSSSVGKMIYKAASQYITPVTLELGGKSPVYLDHSANIEMATKRILWGKCANSGQTCVAPDYLLCTKQVQDKFVYYADQIIKQFYGDEIKKSSDFSRIINERHFNRLLNLMQNLNIAIGGDFDRKERYISPTIAVDVQPTDPIMQEEVFGPILPILIVRNVEEAIDYINRNEKPLALYIFSRNRNDCDLLVKNTSSGGVTINDTILHASINCLPFGGVGMSGLGTYHGQKSFETFSHQKSVLSKDFNPIFEKIYSTRYAPYSEKNLKFIRFALRKRREIPSTYYTHLLMFLLGIVITVVVVVLI